MLRPVGRADTGILDWVPTVDHHIVAYINSYVGDWHAAVIGASEKDDIPGLCVSGGDTGALVVNALRRGAGQVMDAAVGKYPADEAGAVKGGGRVGTSPYIGIAEVFLRLPNQGRKGRVGQGLPGYLVAGFRPCAASRVNAFPQVGLVAL